MAEPIVEQIALWIETAIDGFQDPDATLTLRAVRPELIEWDVTNYQHGDVIIEAIRGDTQSKSASTRTETASWTLHGVVRDVASGTAVDTVLFRLAETIRRLLLAGNTHGQACGGLAQIIDCPAVVYGIIDGGVVAEVTVDIRYQTAVDDGY